MSNINNLYGIENVQAKQLADLNAVYYAGGNPSIAAIGAITTSINQSMLDLSNNITSALSRQNEVLNIANADRNELEERRKKLESVRTTQSRELELMESNRKRYLAQIRGILVIVVAVAILWLIRFLSSLFPFFPDSMLTILYATVIFFAGVIIYYIYSDEQTHDRIQYDELRLKGPDNKPTQMPDTSGNLLNPYFGCNGQECCGLDTIWLPEKGKCVKHDPKIVPPTPTQTPTPTPTPTPTQTPSIDRSPISFEILKPPNF